MTEGKYVVTANGDVRVFDKSGIHAFHACSCPFRDCGGRAVSAGFFNVEAGMVRVYGESATLLLKSRDEDTALVAKKLGL
jgi:hypothetical protein